MPLTRSGQTRSLWHRRSRIVGVDRYCYSPAKQNLFVGVRTSTIAWQDRLRVKHGFPQIYAWTRRFDNPRCLDQFSSSTMQWISPARVERNNSRLV
ncbi:hypothetical protein NP493_1153g00039 [Ridgeia piscesae]|uniref:Uncharacterized protein n=1 Tax=Ridgeia piscesae TaxID=27915 RepID=A0AAD9NJ54_RIDPI|nr:hypothetical protein NP493_1153g00039 [Ridgeia piscesae]